MTTPDNTTENTAPESRLFDFWLTAVDRLTAAAFATAFEDEGITRRDWRILNVIDGTVPAVRELRGPKLRRLAELGWIDRDGQGWTLTDEGAAAKARLSTAVDEIRAQVAAPLTEEEFTTLAASLEKVARGLGWAEGTRLPRPARTRGGRGQRHDRGERCEHPAVSGHERHSHGPFPRGEHRSPARHVHIHLHH